MASRDLEQVADFQASSEQPSGFHSSSASSRTAGTPSEHTALLSSDGPEYKSTALASDEEPSAADEAPSEESKSIFAIISLLMIGVFIANADGTLVLATYGTISSEFGALADAAWLTTSYSLATCAVQPITGKLSDIYGRKPVLLVSYVLFAVGSVICGVGQAMWQIIAGRIVAGVGAAGMTVIVAILITDLVPMIQIASWRSYVNIAATSGRSIGGPLGGLLADTIGWRWSFVGQAPLISIAIILVALRLPSHTSSNTPSAQQKGQPSKLRRIDFIGAFLLAATIVSLLGALSLGGQSLPWSHPVVLILAIGSVVLGVLFVGYETKYALEPVLPPALMVQRDVVTSYYIVALQVGAQLAMMYSVPLYFRVTQNSNNTTAGSHLFPAVVGNAIGGLLAGAYITRTGRYKSLTILATVSSALSYFLLFIRWNGNTSWLESLEVVPGGFGNGVALSATFIGMTNSIRKEDMAVGTAGAYLMSGVGTVIGVAAGSTVQVAGLKSLLQTALRDSQGWEQLIQKVISDVSSIAGLDPSTKKVVIEAYVESLGYSHLVSLSFSLVAFVLALTIREHRLK